MNPTLTFILEACSFLALLVFTVLVGKQVKDLFTKYKIDIELVKKDNLAVAVSMCGYYLAIAIIFIGALLGPSGYLAKNILVVGGYSLLGILFLNLARIFNDKIIFKNFCSTKEMVEDGNTGVGAVQMGSYVATGLIAAGSLFGEGGGVLTAVAFFILGQLSLLLLTYVYNFVTPFDLHKEIETDNVAAGVSFGGAQIAFGVIIARGVGYNFIDWLTNLLWFGEAVLVGLIALPLVRLFMDRFIVPGENLNKEILEDRNIGAGLLEVSIVISFSAVLFFLL